jgi:predicted small lipoprotein YifL
MTNVTRVFCASLPFMLPLALCVLLLAACGQSGPLFLPDQSPPAAQSENQQAVPDASQDGEPIPDIIPKAVPDPAEVPDDESI